MSSLRIRGGGAAATTKLSTSTTSNNCNNDEHEKIDKMANTALRSIHYCVKMSFLSVLSEIIVTFIDDNIGSKFFGASASSLSWTDYIDIFDSLSFLVFGGGLWYISTLYFRNFTNLDERMTHDNLLELFRAMS